MSYSTMHLTQLALEYDCGAHPDEDGDDRANYATNANHPSIGRYVTWMVLGLPTISQDPQRKWNSWSAECVGD